MIKVFQTKFGREEGNCYNACIATIMGIELENVPDFGKDSLWWDRAINFFEDFGLHIVRVPAIDGKVEQHDDMYTMVSGMGPRGLRHAVVYKGSKLFHDPHPDGGGVIPDCIEYLAPFDIGKHIWAITKIFEVHGFLLGGQNLKDSIERQGLNGYQDAMARIADSTMSLMVKTLFNDPEFKSFFTSYFEVFKETSSQKKSDERINNAKR